MIALGSSLAALLLGPALLSSGRGGARLAAALDAFVVVVVLGVVFLHFVPHALGESGPVALVGMLLGVGLPYWAERGFHAHGRWVKGLALCAFALHAVLDGASLAGAAAERTQLAFVIALVVHRVAEGLAIQHMTRDGARHATALALGFVVLATLLGYGLGEQVLGMGETSLFSFLQTLSSGALLHVVVHGHAGSAGSPRVEALGAALGIAAMVGLTLLDPELAHGVRELGMGTTALALTLHMAPVLLVGTLLTAVLDLRLRPRLAQRFRAAGRTRSVLLGLVSAPCGCDERHALGGHRDTIRGELVGALAHPATLLVSAVLLGPVFALVRFGAGLACALVLPIESAALPIVKARGAAASGASFERALRASLGFLLVGLLAAAWLEPLLAPDLLGSAPVWLALPSAVLLGLPLHACAIGVTPLLVVLAHKGLAAGPLLAFALSASLVRLGAGTARPLHTIAVAGLLSALLGALFERVSGALPVLDLHAHAGAAVEPFELACLLICALAALRTFVLRGPSALFAPLWPRIHAH